MALTKNKKVLAFVEESAQLAQPDNIGRGGFVSFEARRKKRFKINKARGYAAGSEPERVRRGAEYALEELRASGALGEGSFGEMLDELSEKMRFYYEKSNGGGV